MNFRFRDQADSFSLKITQWSSDSDTRPLLISPYSRWTNLLTLMSKSINFTTTPFYSFSFIWSDRFMIIRQFNREFLLWCNSVQYSSRISQITNKTFISLNEDRNGTSTRTRIIYTTIFQLFLCVFKNFV